MNLSLTRAALAASLVFAAPLFVAPAMADDTATEQEAAPAAEPAPEAAETAAAAPEAAPEAEAMPAPPAAAPEATAEPEEEAVTCRYIRLDSSSRRKTRVCRTAEGWRQLNQRR